MGNCWWKIHESPNGLPVTVYNCVHKPGSAEMYCHVYRQKQRMYWLEAAQEEKVKQKNVIVYFFNTPSTQLLEKNNIVFCQKQKKTKL